MSRLDSLVFFCRRRVYGGSRKITVLSILLSQNTVNTSIFDRLKQKSLLHEARSVCMCVCVHVCMYVCMHAWMHVCLYVCMYV